ncbi:MAG: hypothetical protein ABR510_03685 [Trueperaceae bacterium]
MPARRSPSVTARGGLAAHSGNGSVDAGWRTDVGDLRVGHFVGLHGLQVIPLGGAWLQRVVRLGRVAVDGSPDESLDRTPSGASMRA